MESAINVGVVVIAVVVMTYMEYLHMKWIKRKLREGEKP